MNNLGVMWPGLTEHLAAVQGRGEAAGVGVDGDVGGRGVEQRVPHDHRVDDALTRDGGERRLAQLVGGQSQDLQEGKRQNMSE